jgi:hypothetical protein
MTTVQPTLLFSAAFSAASALIYSYIGWRLSRREVASTQARLAWIFFTIWWHGLAASTLISGMLSLFGALDLTSLPLFITANHVSVLVSCLALLGLVYYLIYLFTGNSRTLLPLAIFYGIFYVLLVYYDAASDPVGVTVERWNAFISYRVPMTGLFLTLLLIMLLVPQILGGLAYFTLYFRVPQVTQKYRILLVSWSIIIWFVSPVIALAGGALEQDGWQISSRTIGLAAALTILMAYQPPRWIRQRFGILSLGEENQKG